MSSTVSGAANLLAGQRELHLSMRSDSEAVAEFADDDDGGRKVERVADKLGGQVALLGRSVSPELGPQGPHTLDHLHESL